MAMEENSYLVRRAGNSCTCATCQVRGQEQEQKQERLDRTGSSTPPVAKASKQQTKPERHTAYDFSDILEVRTKLLAPEAEQA